MDIFSGCPRQIKNSRIKAKWTESELGDSGKLPESKYRSSQIQNEESWALFEPARAEFKNAKIKSQTVWFLRKNGVGPGHIFLETIRKLQKMVFHWYIALPNDR